MVKNRWAITAFAAVLMGASCTTAAVNYHYYAIDVEKKQLIGATPKDDLDLIKACTGDKQEPVKCIAMLQGEFFKMKQELLELRKALQSCQKGSPPQ